MIFKLMAGVSLNNIQKGSKAGANCFVAGSSIFSVPDPAGMISQMQSCRIMRAAIISNGELGNVSKLKGMLPTFDYVVCCDGGIRHLECLGSYLI